MDREQGERLCDELNEMFTAYQEQILPPEIFPCKAYIQENKLVIDLNGNIASGTLKEIGNVYGVEDFLRRSAKEFIPALRFSVLVKSYEGFTGENSPYKGKTGAEEFAALVHLIQEYLFAIGAGLDANAAEIAEWVCEGDGSVDSEKGEHLYA